MPSSPPKLLTRISAAGPASPNPSHSNTERTLAGAHAKFLPHPAEWLKAGKFSATIPCQCHSPRNSRVGN